jgi:isoquinoline 1-oxidoreductase alpha subunit
MNYSIKINGQDRTVETEPDTPLLWVLRDDLDLKGTKFGCGAAFCGACTVHLDGMPVRACQTPVSRVGTRAVTTIEGVGASEVGKRVQEAWMEVDVMQCGYCQAGQIMSATALLTRTPKPSDEQITQAMNGNLCRCATYNRIKAAVRKAAGLPTVEA